MMKNNPGKTLTLLLVLVANASAITIAGEINTGSRGNVAIKGYDPVAYFIEQRAMRGKVYISYNWLGAIWYFSTEKHKALFSESPVKFAPQYGGHCADGVALGVTVTDLDPEAWRIIEGKLYLNADQAAATELVEVEGQLEKSVENWPEIRKSLLQKAD